MPRSVRLTSSRAATDRLAHLVAMVDGDRPVPCLGPVLTLAQLAAQLGEAAQTLYDLRHHGGGSKGFKVGRELRFRLSEVQAWLAHLGDA